MAPKDAPSRKRFANLLIKHGGVSVLCEINTGALRRELKNVVASDRQFRKRATMAGVDLNTLPGRIDKFLDDLDKETALEVMERVVAQHFASEEAELLKDELYRGTVAGSLYKGLRNPLVHAFGLVRLSLTDGETSHPFGIGQSKPLVEFDELHLALTNVVAYARGFSTEREELFGKQGLW